MNDEEKAKRQAEYQRKYENKRVVKKVSFNLENEGDLLEIANNLDFSQWVKQAMREKFKK
ncbi:hypothetical protein [Neisseria lactamica]|uniref:Phage associated protein n=1 Tax=Neisseria lactamica TaxID=486 RepID=A0AAU8VTT7_NEILA|nr:hypothetical protein [Neisseria lactamica]ARB04809.1 hypothetical protein B2G52_07855 [Neisseria lactamica]CBX21291.1 unnamed protein product [Neisseria lactamica Y92-1009]